MFVHNIFFFFFFFGLKSYEQYLVDCICFIAVYINFKTRHGMVGYIHVYHVTSFRPDDCLLSYSKQPPTLYNFAELPKLYILTNSDIKAGKKRFSNRQKNGII